MYLRFVLRAKPVLTLPFLGNDFFRACEAEPLRA
jgi:hypothetical protein